jgi:hypothetical protein
LFEKLAYSFTNSILAEKAKISKGRMIIRQNNCVITLPKNYSAYLAAPVGFRLVRVREKYGDF